MDESVYVITNIHNPVENWAPNGRMNIGQFEEYVNMVDLARKEWKGRMAGITISSSHNLDFEAF